MDVDQTDCSEVSSSFTTEISNILTVKPLTVLFYFIFGWTLTWVQMWGPLKSQPL